MKPQRVSVVCPRCGHAQQEPAAAYSSRCRKCGEHFRLEEVLRPGAREAGAPRAEPSRRARPEPSRGPLKRVTCFQCGTELEVAPSAQSTMCKRCSGHVDLRDYEFTATASKNFKTKGRCVLHEGACLLNTDSTFGHAIIRGKVIGRITADELELHRTAEIKGSFKAGTLIIPIDTVFRWRETVVLNGADIAGELVANIQAKGVVKVRATGRLFGNVVSGGLEVEGGAVLVGSMKIGVSEPEPVVAPAPTARIIPLPKPEPAMALPRH